MDRINQALAILTQYKAQNYHYLGSGFAGVVFHDNEFVYKVHIPKVFGDIAKYRNHSILTLNRHLHLFIDSKNIIQPIKVLEIANVHILIYEYEKSDKVTHFEEEEVVDFLTECWTKKIIILDIKPENFIRINGTLKLIDVEIDLYTDNYFLNMVARFYSYLKYPNIGNIERKKINRSAINQFELEEISGIQEFSNKIFANIIYEQSKHSMPRNIVEHSNFFISQAFNQESLITEIENGNQEIIRVSSEIISDFKKLFFDLNKKGFYLCNLEYSNIFLNDQLYFEPEFYLLQVAKLKNIPYRVSLIIKACPQDSATLYHQTLHIIKQLSSPDMFIERIIAIDKRERDFLRQYTDTGSLQELRDVCLKLIQEGLIDRIIEIEDESIELINQRWFGFKTNVTHTYDKIPVTAQIYSFEEAKGDFIFQMDCDVMIGRRDYNHSFLSEMINEFQKNPNVISVGFNIYQKEPESFTKYFGFENGGFVPEVRMGLIHKERLMNLLPLENSVIKEGFELSWYCSLHKKQKQTDTFSIRGGNSKSFFIHPQNYRKTSRDVWFTILDRVEQGFIPEIQDKEFDLSGSYHDWCIQKRNEDMVIVCLVRNIEYSRFLRMWESLISQTYLDWGLVLIDDASSNGLDELIYHTVQSHKKRVTYVRNYFQQGIAANTYKAIHYFIENKNSIIVILDGDDALIGNSTLMNIFEKYKFMDADVTLGKMYRTDKIVAHYKYTPNLINPRKYGGNVWQHLRTFRKYLFDSLSIYDLKISSNGNNNSSNLLLSKLNEKYEWIPHCIDYAYMVPIIEMSSNPIIIDFFNYYHQRNTINTPEIRKEKDRVIREILKKPSKSPKSILMGRKTFLPNLKKIELDITYDCNLKCLNCNRSCTQAPTKEQMTFDQIKEFIRESIELNKKWELINILGGEPTLHKDFLNIVNFILNSYIQEYSKETILQVTSNGFSNQTKRILNELPIHQNLIIDTASFKESREVLYFSAFNNAPIDNPEFQNEDFSKGCWVTSYCGISLNMYGYYVCSVSGGIDRVFNFKKGIKSLKNVDESIKNQLDTFCRYCGNYSDYAVNKGDFIPRNEKAPLKKEIISDSWLNVYKKWSAKK